MRSRPVPGVFAGACIAAAWFGLAGAAQAGPRRPAGEAGRARVEPVGKGEARRYRVDFDSASLVEAVRAMSALTAKSYVVPEALREERVTLVSGAPMLLAEVEAAFASALDVNNLRLVPEGAVIRIERVGGGPHTEGGRSGPAGCPDLAGIREAGEGTWRLPRELVDRLLAETRCWATSARIVPAFQDGQALGFKLFSIRPRSLYAALGIQNGDVITSIHGRPFTNPTEALEIYASLRAASEVRVTLTRRGKPCEHLYLVDGPARPAEAPLPPPQNPAR